MNISYLEVNEHEIDIIRPLWEKLKDHHLELSPNFAERYIEFTFDERKEELLNKSKKGFLKIDLVKDEDTEWLIGYCISSISDELMGEIDSIYLEEKYRSIGIGNELVKRSLQWMDKNGVKTKKIIVAVGNEDSLPFYERNNFFPRHIILEQK